MHRKKVLLFIFVLLLISACADTRPALITDYLPAERSVPAERSAPAEQAIRLIKADSPEIRKYAVLEGDSITVKADMGEAGELSYDLVNARQEGSRLLVDFSLVEKTSGITRQDTLVWEPGREDDAGILLAFDDAYMESWERYLDLFDQYGSRVTFFVQGDLSPFCSLASKRGHDIGYHTLNHADLRKVSREGFFRETLSAVRAFRDAGIPLVSFAYPFGFSEPWMHEALLGSFSVLRGYGVTFRIYDREAIRGHYISSRAIDNLLFKQDEDFEAAITLMLRTVKFIGRGSVLPLTTHDISDTAVWGIKPRRLEYLLRTAKALNLGFYCYGDFSG
jgi:hypothetical protein